MNLCRNCFNVVLLFVGDSEEGLRKSELIAWYLDEIQDEIDCEEDLLERKSMIEKIIDRLVYHDRIIIPLTSNKKAGEGEDEDPMLVVHPNYIIE